jgi:hypothetical protein
MEENKNEFDYRMVELSFSERAKNYKNYYAFFTYSNAIGYCETSCGAKDCFCKKQLGLDRRYVDALKLGLNIGDVQIKSNSAWVAIERKNIPQLLNRFKQFTSFYGVDPHLFVFYVHEMYHEQTRQDLLEHEPEWDQNIFLMGEIPDHSFDKWLNMFPDHIIHHIRREAAEQAGNQKTDENK